MNAATLILVIAASFIAFWTGSRWRYNKLAWADHRVARAKERTLRKLRWITLRTAIVAIVVLAIWLIGIGAITLPIRTGHTVPAGNVHTRPSPQPDKSMWDRAR